MSLEKLLTKVAKSMCVEICPSTQSSGLQTGLPHILWHFVLEFDDMFSARLIMDNDQKMNMTNASNNSNF
jgi:hypothetical protein